MDWTRGRTLGRGSSATVSLATAHPSGDVFAVKSVELLRSEFLQREQRILSLLNCANIVGYKGFDIKEENGQLMYNLFMEYISGGTLSDAVQKQGGGLDEFQIQSHTRSILLGLEYLHSNRLVHCDIKGRNVLIGPKGTKIADLGCARWVDDEVSGAVKATTMAISGTPVFMAPEVARGEEQSFPSDVWSVGCTMIEMATGGSPWPDVADPVSALYRIGFSGDVPEFPRFLSEQAKDFLSKCLRRNPRERWTAGELLKHPFLNDPNSHSKQIQDSVFNSPTSILDQGIWDSFEESETPRNLISRSSSNSPAEKIRRLSEGILASSTSLPNWTLDENWVTVRGNSNNEEPGISPGDETTTTTSGSATVWISDNEELEFCYGSGSSVFDEDFCNFSFYNISISTSIRKNRRRGFSLACKLIEDIDLVVTSDLNFERYKQRELSVSFNPNSLKKLKP